MTEQKYLNAREAAARLGITKGLIYNMLRRGEFITGVYFGRCRRWNVDDVDRWASEQKKER